MLPSLMKAEVISIGTELLLGEILDTNSKYLGSPQHDPEDDEEACNSQAGERLRRLFLSFHV